MTHASVIASFYGIGIAEMFWILITLACVALWIWMLIDCATKEPPNGVRIVWILAIAVLGIIGALLYLFARKIPRKFRRPHKALEPPPVVSAFHRAASYAVWVIPVSVGLTIVAACIFPLLIAFGLGNFVSYIIFAPVMLFVSAIPAGVAALCGIPKYGPRTLLWKGLVGVLLPSVILALMIPKVQEQTSQLREQFGLPEKK